MFPAVDDIIKKPNQLIQYTEQQIRELQNCVRDPLYFCKNFVKVRDTQKGLVPFIPYPYQGRLITAFYERRFTVAMCARQLGKTTCAASFLLWEAMFRPDITILIVGNTYNMALEIMDRIRVSYENVPDHIRCGVREYNKGTITFDNGSKIVSRATTPNSGRGLSITRLYCDEYAYVPRNIQKAFWASIRPVLSTGGSCIITSTPKSDEDEFAQIYKSACINKDEYGNETNNGLGANEFFAITVPWFEHPARDEAWARTEKASIGEARFAQEFCNQFVTDDSTLINPMTLLRLKSVAPIFYVDQVRWYHEPEANKAFLIALDPAIGNGGDDAAIQIFQLPEMVQVGEWQHNNTDAKGQVRMLMRALLFLDAHLRNCSGQTGEPEIYWTIENNSIGETVLMVISDTGIEKFPGEMISEKRRAFGIKRRKGLNTNNRNKLAACMRLRSLIESDRLKVNSNNLLAQLKSYVSIGITFKGKSGEKDDLVAATLLVVRMLDRLIETGFAVDEKLQEGITDDELRNTPAVDDDDDEIAESVPAIIL